MCHIENGSKNDITLVFSCPGQVEEQFNKPAAGQTGTNLEIVLNYLNQRHILDWERDDITITNASDKPEYTAKSNRTEATFSEITNSSNLLRLQGELENTSKYIVTFGKNANHAVNSIEKSKLNPNVKVIESSHLSFSNINRSIKSEETSSQERTKDRLEQLAQNILEKL